MESCTVRSSDLIFFNETITMLYTQVYVIDNLETHRWLWFGVLKIREGPSKMFNLDKRKYRGFKVTKRFILFEPLNIKTQVKQRKAASGILYRRFHIVKIYDPNLLFRGFTSHYT